MTAAPETETDANGLTEAERGLGVYGYKVNASQLVYHHDDVERIVAERVRVVEGERDAAQAELRAESRRADKAVVRANHYEGQFRVREQEPDQRARAESAEAAHEAEKAAHERLRAEIEEKIAKYSRLAGQAMDPECREWLTAFVGTLRPLLLGGGGAR